MSYIVVTGCAGFIGMHTVMRLLKEGKSVIGVDNVNDYYSVQLKRDRLKKIDQASKESDNWLFLEKSVTDSLLWAEISDYEVEGVIHLAAQAGVRYSLENPRAYLDSNIIGFQYVIEFCIANNIKTLLYASSSSVYGQNSQQPFSESEPCVDPVSFYAATKRMNEFMAQVYAKTHALNSVGLRFFTVYGPYGRPDMAPMIFANAALKNEQVNVFNYGKQKRDFTYIDDIIEGIICVFNVHKTISGSHVFNIGKGKPDSLSDFISLMERFAGAEVDKNYVEAQKGDVEETFASIDKISKLCGYKPEIALEQGLGRFMKWYKDYYNY
jgi:UDP-glucuronate 4-epimerase